MNELIARAGAFFVEPAAAASPASVATGPPADLVCVLAARADVDAVAGGVAADLRRRHRAKAALVCRPGPVGTTHVATHAARRLAQRIAARDLPAAPAGPLCRVALPDQADHAVRDAWRAITASAGCPAVVALPERSADYDALLAHADELYLALPADVDRAYAELALASLAALGPPATLIHPPATFATRRLATLGLRPLHPPAEAAA